MSAIDRPIDGYVRVWSLHDILQGLPAVGSCNSRGRGCASRPACTPAVKSSSQALNRRSKAMDFRPQFSNMPQPSIEMRPRTQPEGAAHAPTRDLAAGEG